MNVVHNICKPHSFLNSLCKKTPTTAPKKNRGRLLFSFLKQSFTKSKLFGFKNFESLVFDASLSKTEKYLVFMQALKQALSFQVALSEALNNSDFVQAFHYYSPRLKE